MRYIDLIGQSLILLLCAIVVTIQVFRGDEPIAPVLIAAFYLGVWQMISCLIALIVRAPFFRLRGIHFFIAVAFLSLTPLLGKYGNLGLAVSIMIVTIPASLAAFYYFITWKWVLIRTRKSGKFLPNVFF